MSLVRNSIAILAALALALGMGVLGVARAFAQPEAVTLPVTVECTGLGSSEEAFTVQIEALDGAPSPLDGVVEQTVMLSSSTSSAQASFAFSYDTPGTYVYSIKQKKGSLDNVVYDDSVYRVSVFVENQATGLSASITVGKAGSSEKPDAVLFSNERRQSGPDSVIGDPPITITKSVKGDKPTDNPTFSFEMKPDKEEYPLPMGYGDGPVIVKLRLGETVEIGNIEFTEEGTYTYQIVELDDKQPGYNYDDATFKVVYVVKRNNEGTLVCDRTIMKNSSTTTECNFVNEYKDPGTSDDDSNSDSKSSSDKAATQSGKTPKTGDILAHAVIALAITAVASFVLALFARRKSRRSER